MYTLNYIANEYDLTFKNLRWMSQKILEYFLDYKCNLKILHFATNATVKQ